MKPDERCQEQHKHTCLIQTARAHILDDDKLDPLCDIFKVLSDPTRMRIILTLVDSEMCVCDIAQLLGMTQSAISHQLRSLKQSRLVKARREGKTVFYSLADGHVRTILDQGMEHVAELLPLHIL